MAQSSSRRATSDRRRGGHTSVVGSKFSDVSNSMRGRGLPRGGIRERDGLKVAEGALPDSTIIGQVRPGTGRRILRVVAIVSASLLALVVVVTLVLTLLSHTSAFSVTSVLTQDSEHITADEIARLADIGEGVTLLNVDESAIEAGVMKNPWVASVDVDRIFPDQLAIRVHERRAGALVAMGSGGLTWLLGSDGVWIEPMRIDVGDDESDNDAALANAESMGLLLITNVPSSVDPVAGSRSTDATIASVMSFEDQFSDYFKELVVSYAAPDVDDVSCILASGIEVSLGAPTNVHAKEQVATRVLDEYTGQITYINVRVPSRPSYRRVDSSYVGEGSGATGTTFEPGSPYDSHVGPDESQQYGQTTDYGTIGNGADALGD